MSQCIHSLSAPVCSKIVVFLQKIQDLGLEKFSDKIEIMSTDFCVENVQSQTLYRLTTGKQSETTDLRQRNVVRQVAAPYSVWQRFPLCPIESNVNENFKVIQNPGFLLDHPQN